MACPLYTFPEIVNVNAAINHTDNGNHSNQSKSTDRRLTCVSIPVTVLRPNDPLSLVLIVLVALCAAISLTVIMVYMSHHNHRLIKATSRELSAIILTGRRSV